MERDHKIEEALSIVWDEREKNVFSEQSLRPRIVDKVGEDILDTLIKEGYITLDNSKAVRFTIKGEGLARDITRRQRLAERLLIDVLELGRREMDYQACEFEHILSKEVEESICTLLGHPKECPHGLPIPSGDCCRKAKDYLESVVVSLSKLSAGEAARIVYVLTREHPQLHKLMAFGVTPGAKVFVHQVSPSFVIQVDQTQVALESEIAKEIFVKRVKKGEV
ncbi:MAG: metal-dependent transcriptional regulator [Candidatus Omnitrophota bacterium]|nr:metal-dependent transcriptional regulator [Candidatus Omnitrophota bacterium]